MSNENIKLIDKTKESNDSTSAVSERKNKGEDEKHLTIPLFLAELKQKGTSPLKVFGLFSLLLTVIYLFSFFIFKYAYPGTPADNKIVIGCLALYITALFIMTDLIPSSSPSKKWFSICCRVLTGITTILSITFFI